MGQQTTKQTTRGSQPGGAGRYLSVAFVLVFLACGARSERPFATPAVPPANPLILLGVPGAIAASGLPDSLLPYFEQTTGYRVKPVSDPQKGTADVFIASAGGGEIAAGTNRGPVMSVDFVIVGPAADRAHLRGKQALEALKAVASTGATWVSRRDGSDTNRLELDLWQAALGRDAQHEGWYVSTYADMTATLKVADRRQAYTLTDRATFLSERDNLHLDVLAQGDPLLSLPYDIVEAGTQVKPDANLEGARVLADYMLSPQAQTIIAGYGVAEYGQPLFRGARGVESGTGPDR